MWFRVEEFTYYRAANSGCTFEIKLILKTTFSDFPFPERVSNILAEERLQIPYLKTKNVRKILFFAV